MYQRIQEMRDIKYRMKVVNEQFKFEQRLQLNDRIKNSIASKFNEMGKNMNNRFNKKQVEKQRQETQFSRTKADLTRVKDQLDCLTNRY